MLPEEVHPALGIQALQHAVCSLDKVTEMQALQVVAMLPLGASVSRPTCQLNLFAEVSVDGSQAVWGCYEVC